MVPGEDGEGAAVGAPGFGEPAGAFLVGLSVEAHDAAGLDLHREIAEAWRPHRGAFAIFAWHHRRNSAAPV